MYQQHLSIYHNLVESSVFWQQQVKSPVRKCGLCTLYIHFGNTSQKKVPMWRKTTWPFAVVVWIFNVCSSWTLRSSRIIMVLHQFQWAVFLCMSESTSSELVCKVTMSPPSRGWTPFAIDAAQSIAPSVCIIYAPNCGGCKNMSACSSLSFIPMALPNMVGLLEWWFGLDKIRPKLSDGLFHWTFQLSPSRSPHSHHFFTTASCLLVKDSLVHAVVGCLVESNTGGVLCHKFLWHFTFYCMVVLTFGGCLYHFWFVSCTYIAFIIVFISKISILRAMTYIAVLQL